MWSGRSLVRSCDVLSYAALVATSFLGTLPWLFELAEAIVGGLSVGFKLEAVVEQYLVSVGCW